MALPVAELPVLPADSSMLSRKFGREAVNYYANSPLNRVSFLRTDHVFLRSAFAHPSARFLLVNDLAPLVQVPATTGNGSDGAAPAAAAPEAAVAPRLAWSVQAEIAPVTGTDPFAATEEEAVKNYDSSKEPPAIVLFLGIDDNKKLAADAGSAGSADASSSFVYKTFQGRPYFAVDVTPRGSGSIATAAQTVIEAVKAKGLSFHTNARSMSLAADEASVYAQARALLDWNARHPFCAQCGQTTMSVNAGTKRVCPPTDLAGSSGNGGAAVERKACAARRGVSNLSFPRTDPTAIMAIVSADGKRVLLGRSKRFPPYWYSTLAGFLEPGESIEEAVRREVWEEAGVKVGRVVVHSSQPWPYPANLMIGAIGQATGGEAGETIFLGHDPELEDARWFPMDAVRRALLVDTAGLDEAFRAGYKEGDLRLPPRTAIANQLLAAVANGFVDGDDVAKI